MPIENAALEMDRIVSANQAIEELGVGSGSHGRSRVVEGWWLLDVQRHPQRPPDEVRAGRGGKRLPRTNQPRQRPDSRPARTLGSIGLPEDLIACIGYGIDLFDCVIPTRYARSASVFTARGRIRLTNRRYRRDAYPVDTSCGCYTCTGGFTRAYIHHLFAANEVLSAVLCSIHNVHFYQRLVAEARRAILTRDYATFAQDFLARYQGEPDAT